jgi:hypothetical protein
MRNPLCIALFAVLLLGPVSRAADPPDFDREIAPLLARACLDCHGGAKPKGRLDLTHKDTTFAGGKVGPAVVPGKLDDSPLWLRVQAEEMPPKKPLAAADRELLRAWIAAGARWGSDPIDPFRFTTAKRAGYDWWSLRPVVRPAMPAIRTAGWVRTPVDAFVLAKLEASGLGPAPEADRRTLIRRLSYDLLGLPPAREEVEAFVRDPDPMAYEKLVDRLLASPHYGERWARHWLDVVRFGESNGFERDLPRTTAWPYRDWVVRAFNDDLPYTEFVQLQLAGDMLRPDNPAALTATGFLVAGPHDTVVPSSDVMRKGMQQDELEDLLGTVGQSFLGLTVNCARCHDHKFDPIAQKDYYRLAAALSGAQPGERDVLPAKDVRLTRLQEQIDELARQRQAMDDPARRAVLAAREAKHAKTPVPQPLAEWDFTTDLKDHVGGLHGTRFGEAKADRSGLRLDGKTGYVLTEPLQRDLGEKTLEVWARLDNLTQRGGGVIGVQSRDGVLFDALVFGEQEEGRWMAGSNFFKRTESFHAPAETQATRELVHMALVYGADGTISAYRNGQPYGKPYRSSGLATFKAGEAQMAFGVRHTPSGSNKMLAGLLVRARLHERALTADEVAASAGVLSDFVPEADLVAMLSAEQRAQRLDLLDQTTRLQAERERIRATLVTKVYAVVSQQPGPSHVLLRGNVADPGEPVTPGGLAALPGAEWQLKGDAPERDRRLSLARWITKADNPLLPRVMVNRLWHYHFGIGLVDTPNDFGFNGGRPSHPELLDWLAAEFVHQGWSVKAMHRTLVLSATYRQESRPRADARKIDAGNRLLWCRSPQRLEAEAVRDAMLSVSGQLDPAIGGRGFQDFKSVFFKGTQFYEPVEQVGPEFARRSLYRMWARGGRNPFLDTFDCPDPSTTTPRRAVTTTPLQALTLLNNAFALHAADAFADRLRRTAGDDESRQIALAYEFAYGRAAEEKEIALARPFVTKHGLAAFCRLIFNSNEFIHVD